MTREFYGYVLFPVVCARCAERSALVLHACTRTLPHRVFMLLTTFAGGFGFYSYDLPICESCSRTLKRQDAATMALVAPVTALFTGGGLLLSTASQPADRLLHGLVGGALGFVLVTWIVVLAFLFLGNNKFSGYDGKRFTFRNKTYRAQFAFLNPDLIRARPPIDLIDVPIFSLEKAVLAFAAELIAELQMGRPYTEIEKRARSVGLDTEDLKRVLAALAPYRQ